MGRNNFGGSLQVESVQALASKGLKNNIPPRYIRPQLELDEISLDDSLSIPIIDMSKLDDIDESFKLHYACKDWGFFQLINHGISEVVEEMKVVSEAFFTLPQEEKMVYAQVPGDVEGYGQANILSEDQKLDWNDMLTLMTRPIPIRNIKFWPTSPTGFSNVTKWNKMDDEYLTDALMIYIEKEIAQSISNDEILEDFRDMKERRVLF